MEGFVKILEEIEFYCKQKNSIGALQIIGEWGSGKTYFIENTLSDDDYITSNFNILKISLFGIETVQQLNQELKKEYLVLKYQFEDNFFLKNWNKLSAAFENPIKKFKMANMIISADWSIFVELEDFANKELLIIFDDFERCLLDIESLMGVINEQTEQKRIKTIIIANEDFILSDGQEEKYRLMKEKVISRTIRLEPNIDEIKDQIIEEYHENIKGYKNFLRTEKGLIKRIFLDSKSSNIRSLTVGIQDYERFYQVINQHIEDKNLLSKLMSGFMMLVYEYKLGNLKDYEDEAIDKANMRNLYVNDQLRRKYVSYNDWYILSSMKAWIINGKWEKELLIDEIEIVNKKMKDRSPKDIILDYGNILFLEDDTLNCGFQPLIEEAYKGAISLNSYMSLFSILVTSEMYNVELPCEINYHNLREGIEKRISEVLSGKEKENHTIRNSISKENLQYLKQESKKLVVLIEDARNDLLYTSNRHIVLKALESKDRENINVLIGQYTGPFDVKYANNLLKYYFCITNSEKIDFINDLEKQLENEKLFSENNKKKSLEGIEFIITELDKIKNSGKIVDIHNNKLLEKARGILLKRLEE